MSFFLASVLCELVFVAFAVCYTRALLVFPPSSVLQITVSVSVPVELPARTVFWDWGLQMNYDLPSNLQQLHNANVWQDEVYDRKRRDMVYGGESNATAWLEADRKYRNLNMEGGKHSNDFTAGELYHSFEDLLVSYGFHETCLLRSVCELARHPFSNDQENILSHILTFILTPSIHECFSSSEHQYREAYEEAERLGFLHGNCTELYGECEQDLLTIITTVLTNSKLHHSHVN